METTYDLIVLGGGTAGYASAGRAAELERSAMILDAGPPGGQGFYLGSEGLRSVVVDPGFMESKKNWEEIRSRGREWVDRATRQRKKDLEESGVQFVSSKGHVVSPRAVEFKDESGVTQVGEGMAVILATGSKVKPDPSIPFDGDRIQTLDEIWDWPELPGSVLIAGSNPESLEWAFVLRRLGVKVFLVHNDLELLSNLDGHLLDFCEKSLKKEKVKILLNKKITSIYKNKGGIDVALDGGVRFNVDRLLMCGEREVDLEDTLKLPSGPDRGHLGEVLVDEKQKTTVAGIFAAGSVTGHHRCRYRSREEGRVAAANALGKKKSLHSQLIPRVLHFSEEIASVGCNLELAHHLGYRGLEGRAGTIDMQPGQSTRPFIKLVFEKKSREIIGGQALGPHAGDIIDLVQIGMRKGQRMSDFCEFQGNGEPFLEELREAADDARRKGSE